MAQKPVGERIAKVETELPYVKDGLETVRADVSALKDDVGTLKVDVAVLKTDVGVLKTDVGVLKADVSALKEDVGDLKKDTTHIKNALQDVKTCSEANAKALSGISKHLNGNSHTHTKSAPKQGIDVAWGKWSGKISVPGVKELVVLTAIAVLLTVGAIELYVFWQYFGSEPATGISTAMSNTTPTTDRLPNTTIPMKQ